MKKIRQFLRFRSLLLGTAAFLGLASHASAHAFLDYSVPKVGSVVTNAPDQILICFTSHLKLHGSTIQVRNAKGEEVDKKDSHCDRKDWAKLLVSLPKLSPGIYKVYWHAIGDDGHVTDGHFEFTIKRAMADHSETA
ncbi:MAG TPA: copper resistance protein CopC [Candidatus Binatia bacterium]|nr:copper resistance protein CopC [Candidatus Binatia bacterium]